MVSTPPRGQVRGWLQREVPQSFVGACHHPSLGLRDVIFGGGMCSGNGVNIYINIESRVQRNVKAVVLIQ